MTPRILLLIVSVPGIFLAAYGLYFAAIALLGLRRHLSYPKAVPQARFAVVVAARNEEAVIGNLVDSLKRQNYPRELYDIIVAPNNCTDNTRAVAAKHGARIFLPSGKVTGKGDVLQQAVSQIVLPEGYDAMCIVDADNLVEPHFLARMNDAYAAGGQAAQGFRDSKNPRQSTVSGCYSISYWMLSHFYNRSRHVLGLSSLIGGSGFMVSAKLLRRLGGWNTSTMTEDYEFSAQCVLAGERVYFVPDAIIYDEQPLTFVQSWKQRRRWTTGSLQGLELYGGRLFARAVDQHDMVSFDMYLTFLSPILQVVSTVTGVIAGGLMLWQGRLVPMHLFLIVAVAAGSVLASAVGCAVVALAAVLMKQTPMTGMAKSILSFWLFMFSWMVITFVSIVKKQKSWDPIAHTQSVTISELQR